MRSSDKSCPRAQAIRPASRSVSTVSNSGQGRTRSFGWIGHRADGRSATRLPEVREIIFAEPCTRFGFQLRLIRSRMAVLIGLLGAAGLGFGLGGLVRSSGRRVIDLELPQEPSPPPARKRQAKKYCCRQRASNAVTKFSPGCKDECVRPQDHRQAKRRVPFSGDCAFLRLNRRAQPCLACSQRAAAAFRAISGATAPQFGKQGAMKVVARCAGLAMRRVFVDSSETGVVDRDRKSRNGNELMAILKMHGTCSGGFSLPAPNTCSSTEKRAHRVDQHITDFGIVVRKKGLQDFARGTYDQAGQNHDAQSPTRRNQGHPPKQST